MVLDKSLIHSACLVKIENRIHEITTGINLANESLISDTKSSMGDKYETSREMAQQDLTRLQNQLKQAESDLQILKQLSNEVSGQIRLGNLVVTDEHIYYLAISIGQVEVNGHKIMVISAKSPIGMELIGTRVGDKISFQKRNIEILKIS
ncbi:GreA/GreB family elongation factor [Sphingobacterium sp. HJSM2_6]|uniref:GreA/GreB family elongation factor n=1 Tax=Sphingobacterium sp. HJSM2_6 TaxID=3366264 RepID=UPI003BDDE801